MRSLRSSRRKSPFWKFYGLDHIVHNQMFCYRMLTANGSQLISFLEGRVLKILLVRVKILELTIKNNLNYFTIINTKLYYPNSIIHVNCKYEYNSYEYLRFERVHKPRRSFIWENWIKTYFFCLIVHEFEHLIIEVSTGPKFPGRPEKFIFRPGPQSMYYKICSVQFFLKYYSKINIIT